ncbi:hypothetical protein CC86DRAFT_450789 [Ophiobolus disseminans]|uniref:Uncharacterized protein n=1 Tax=Ophiobolus disseminans TaxID=1469910 RepID=A0A6A7AJ18_9PLEO|nr:hypothetical protein CC86DRAFT_450789 [Ophiobolus disseminans]
MSANAAPWVVASVTQGAGHAKKWGVVALGGFAAAEPRSRDGHFLTSPESVYDHRRDLLLLRFPDLSRPSTIGLHAGDSWRKHPGAHQRPQHRTLEGLYRSVTKANTKQCARKGMGEDNVNSIDRPRGC